jgi:hypothetical protein
MGNESTEWADVWAVKWKIEAKGIEGLFMVVGILRSVKEGSEDLRPSV